MISNRRQQTDQRASTTSEGDSEGRTQSARLQQLLQRGEDTEFVFRSPDQTVERERGARTDRYSPPEDDVAVAAVTDHRVVVYAPTSGTHSVREQRFPIHFTDIERVHQDDPETPSRISIRLTNGDRWHFPVTASDSETVPAATRYVSTGVTVFTRAQSAATTVHKSRGELLDSVRKDHDWNGARDRYHFLSERIADARRQAESTPFADAPSLTQTLDQAEQTVEAEYTSALLARIDQHCAAGRRHFEAGDVEAGCDALEAATERYRAILDRLGQSHIDLFDDVFGSFDAPRTMDDERSPLSADTLHRALGIVVDRIASVGTVAVDTAQTRLADFDDIDRIGHPETMVEPLQTALSVYRTVLYCCWTNAELAPIARQSLQGRVEDTAAALIEARRRVAERAEWKGSSALEEGEPKQAVSALSTAEAHYERAAELAGEFRAGDPTPLRNGYERTVELQEAMPALCATRRES